jgi:cobalt/nickel transport system ATP-binding protein
MMLEARGIHYAYPGSTGPALRDASLTIARGERLALLGVNGAGKSTLFQMLNGSLKPREGSVHLDGQPVTYDRKGLNRLRQAVGLVMQDPDDQLFAATVAEDVSFGPVNLGLPEAEVRARVDEALTAMGIAGLRANPTHMLSFGQKKRTAIAGLLAMRPSVLLLDEPTAGLDPEGIEDLMQALSRLAEGGTAVVIATHDMDLAWSWASRVAVFENRAIGLAGPPETVFSDRDRLRSLGLRPPVVYEVGLALKEAALTDRLPRNLGEVLAVIVGKR